jgi:cytochrome b involved in lipid metabolism
MCLASNLVKEAAQHAASAKEADAVLRREHTTFTRREVEARRHDLVIIEDKVYDAETFQWAHPGGSLFVAMFGGRDGTLAFQSYHMRSFPHEKMRPYLRGRLCAGEAITRMDS